ncbi:hypothetical protein QQ045_017127 [Rhodiola kirilowii]
MDGRIEAQVKRFNAEKVHYFPSLDSCMQRQYFEQRRRQQQQQATGSDNYLEENGCSTSKNERRSLDVLSLNTLSNIAKKCNSRCLNAAEAVEVNIAGDKIESNASQTTILSLSGNPSKDPVQSVSKEQAVCNPPCSNEKYLKSSNANLDPLNNEISVLDILEDDGLQCNFRENSMHEDHVSFSVGGLGEVGTETPLNSPPHRMEPRGGSSCSNAYKDVKMSKNLLNDIELEVEAAIQDIDTSLNSKSSKFRSYSTSPAKQVENRTLKMYFPDDDMQFDEFDSRLRDTVCGKRAYQEDYKKNRDRGIAYCVGFFQTRNYVDVILSLLQLEIVLFRYILIYNESNRVYCDLAAHPNITVDDFVYDIQDDLPWDDGSQKEYMTEECWLSPNLQDNSFKRSQFFCERFRSLPTESTGPVFPNFNKSERSIYFEEDLTSRNPIGTKNAELVDMARYPNQYCFPVEDPKDSFKSSSFDSEESCSSSAVRRDIMDSVAKKSDSKTFSKIYSPKGDVKRFLREDTSGGHRNYVQQGENDGVTRADTVKFDTSSVPSDQPSSLNIENKYKLKTKDGLFVAREKAQSGADSGLASFHKQSKTKSSTYGNVLWDEASVSAFADSRLGDRPKCNGWKSRYASNECAPCNPFFLESLDSPWKADLPLHPDTDSFGVIDSPENCKPPLSNSEYARKDQEADVLDCKLRKRKLDFFAMGVVQIGDKEERCSFKSNRKYLKVPGFGDVMLASPVTASDKYLSDNENEYQREGTADMNAKVFADHEEQRSAVQKTVTSPIDRVLMHQSYVFQFMCVQQASLLKAKEEEI